ncbi:hypothetical protein DMENIID0001_163830 [Sergentomyia squamirostris]
MFIQDKSALVTGASGAIGAAICEEFLQNGLKNLAALDLSSAEPKIISEWRQKFPKATITYFSVDVSSVDGLQKCFKDFTANLNSLDIVVNCAAICMEQNFRKMIEVNFAAVVESMHLAIEYMSVDSGKGRGGVVLNISSITALYPVSLLPTYSATKSAVITLTRAMAHEREHLGIKFLNICPAGTKSNMYDSMKQTEYSFMTTNEKQKVLMAGYPPQGPEDVARASAKIIEEAKSGSVWIIENGQLTEHEIPPLSF